MGLCCGVLRCWCVHCCWCFDSAGCCRRRFIREHNERILSHHSHTLRAAQRENARFVESQQGRVDRAEKELRELLWTCKVQGNRNPEESERIKAMDLQRRAKKAARICEKLRRRNDELSDGLDWIMNARFESNDDDRAISQLLADLERIQAKPSHRTPAPDEQTRIATRRDVQNTRVLAPDEKRTEVDPSIDTLFKLARNAPTIDAIAVHMDEARDRVAQEAGHALLNRNEVLVYEMEEIAPTRPRTPSVGEELHG